MTDFFYSIDVYFFHILNSVWRFGFLNSLMPFVSQKSNWIIPLILIPGAIIIWHRKSGLKLILILALGIAVSDMVSAKIIKPLTARNRPCQVLGQVYFYDYNNAEWIITPQIPGRSYKSSPSFPSSHAANIFAGMILLGLFFPKFRFLFWSFAVLVAWSRVYLGVHYPSDVFFGSVLGWSIAAVFYQFLGNWVGIKPLEGNRLNR